MICKICGAESSKFASARLRAKYDVGYYRCSSCGFVQTEEPYWLGEAYEKAISDSDTGLVARNIQNARAVLSLIRWGGLKGPVLDHAGGYGLLTRILRDHGVDADWYDHYCKNLFSAEYVYDLQKKYNLITAFEVLEHQADPAAYLKDLFKIAPNILFSTQVLPSPCPKPGEWWYYSPETGQHVSFFSKRSLIMLARSLNAYYVSSHDLHFFSIRPMNAMLFRVAANPFFSKFMSFLY